MFKFEFFKKYFSLIFLSFLVFPASNNYQLNEWSFGSGGSQNSGSGNYELNTVLGEIGGEQTGSNNYLIGPGLEFVYMANTPAAPTLNNPSNYYNKLDLIINNGDNPSDTLFAVGISDDDFATTNYVQSDNSISLTLGGEDWQSYIDWGSGSGVTIVGLQPDTTYKVKVKAKQGDFTEGSWGPTATAATSPVSMSFDIDVASTDTESSPPYAVNLGSLEAGSVITGSDRIWIDFETNGAGGGSVYVYGNNSGLFSTTANYTIPSSSTNLAVASEGYGLQVASTAESSGGPIDPVAPYDGAGDNVGVLDSSIRELLNTTSPVTAGRGSSLIKVIVDSTTPAALDYSDTLTLVASATF